jgi:TRAP-type mannitol/chloroaromatic compound transport system permease large subunit
VADYTWWSWINLRYITTIVVMFLMGSAAFTVTREGAYKYRRLGLISLPIGAVAALSIRDFFATFIIFLLAGFVLDWWDIARASD